MKWRSILWGAVTVSALVSSGIASAVPQTYSYAVSHARWGAIGTYVRTFEENAGLTRAHSRLRITVKLLGIVLHREDADQTEVWRGARLMSFQSMTTINGTQSLVRGEARENHFMVATPSGTTLAPADIAASDPWSFKGTGRGTVVSIRSGQIDPVNVTGGEQDTVMLNGVATPARHFHVSTATQPNKWEVWLDPQGFPIKFRSLEHGGAVDFTLVAPRANKASRPLVVTRSQPGPAASGAR